MSDEYNCMKCIKHEIELRKLRWKNLKLQEENRKLKKKRGKK